MLSERGPDSTRVQNWPVVGQFSSIGSLGPDKEAWLTSEWARSLNSCKGASMMQGMGGSQPNLNLVRAFHFIFSSVHLSLFLLGLFSLQN